MPTPLEGGHTESILCADCTRDGAGQIFTGAEGGQLCHWHHDGTLIGRVDFGEDSDVASVVCLQNKPDYLYCSGGEHLHLLDRRAFTAPVQSFHFNEDEINQLSVNDKEEYLAACDDAGQIKVVNLATKKVHKTLRKHTNICASLCFRPKRPWDLLSAGYDQRLLSWDFSRAKVVCDINIAEVGVGPDQFESYLVNPPFIHSISLSHNGHLLACGTENALVHVFDTSKKTPTYMTALRGHTHGVSQVHFPRFDDYTLLSGGNDGLCHMWKLNTVAVSYQVNGYSSSSGGNNNNTSSSASSHHHHQGTNPATGDVTAATATSSPQSANQQPAAPSSNMATASANSDGSGAQSSTTDEIVNDSDDDGGSGEASSSPSPRPCFGIQHDEKINWITTGCSANRKFIVISDSTNEGTVYTYPDS